MAAPEDDLPDLRRTLPERAASWVLPACACEWAGAEVAHLAHASAGPVAIGTAVAASLAFGISGRTGKLAPFVAWAIAGAGGWLSASLAWDPASWPVAIAWAAGSLLAAKLAHKHPAVTAAREWRDARAGWLADSRRWHLGGSHLLHHEFTRLGERMIADVTGTGKLASVVAHSDLPERIASDRKIPRSRVTVAEHKIAGQVVIEVRDHDPWAHPIPHPAVTEGHEVELAERPSITAPQPVGQDPATGRLLTLVLCGPGGGLNVSVVGTLEAGKTTLLSDVSERVTACRDALMIRINLSDKGDAERHLWGPACHLTALGPGEKARALKVLKAIRGIMRWRAQQPKTTANWQPSPSNPHIVLIIDEIDALTEVPALRRELEPIASKGREYGVTIVRAGQRGTAEWTGGANTRAMDGLWCLGALTRSSEAMHAAGELGLRLPDVASYGEGNPGVWIVAQKSGAWQGGRTWNLSEPADIAAIATARAPLQPELPPECVTFLGDDYAWLLGTDVYAQWAHGRTAAPPPEAPPATAPPQPDGGQPAPAHAATVTATVPDDNIDQLDWDVQMDDVTAARLRALDEKLGRTRQILAETAAMDKGPDVPADKLRESAAERWRQVGEQAEIPTEMMGKLLDLLEGGTTMSKVAAELGVKPWAARTWLEKLRGQGVAKVVGERRTARWVRCDQEPPEAAGDGDGS
jgi:hypothetical protein